MTKIIGRARLLFTLLFVGLITLVNVDCGRDPISNRQRDAIPVTELLQRTQTNRWETKRSTELGVQVEVPAHVCGFAENSTLGMIIELHTVPPPAGVVDDKRCLLQIKVERLLRNDFESRRASDPILTKKTDPDYELRRWEYRRHDSISRFDVDRFTFYRYDLDCSNGDVVWALGSITNVYDGGVSLYGKEDEAIVRRIIGSLQCLDLPIAR